MKLSLRLFLGYFFLVAVTGQVVLMLIVSQISPGMRTALEASLVDTANLLAELAVEDLQQGRIDNGNFALAIQRYSSRPISAQIFGFPKQSMDYRVYITDADGIVRFDSAGLAVGQNYSRWNDVYLTLKGEYGVRSSLANPDDKHSSVMHIAAPIRNAQQLIGVLTVAYPTALLDPIVESSQAVVQRSAIWLFGSALAFGALFTWRLTRAIDLLVTYARKASSGEKTTPPKIGSPELATLASALATMRQELEGKQYVEHYVQTLTHEMKSPLAAIKGAAELLEEALPETERLRFAKHAREQAERLDQLIVRLLGLAAVEQRQQLSDPAAIELGGLIRQILEAKMPQLTHQQLISNQSIQSEIWIYGEEFLLQQALSNLLDNAIAFAPTGSSIEIQTTTHKATVSINIRDHGPGIPDYALQRIFERFYSLPRPHNGAKSTGLGLAFVREVALLHQGNITVNNAVAGGVEAVLTLPVLSLKS